MQAAASLGGILNGVAARVSAGGDVSSLGVSWQRSAVRSIRAAASAEHPALGGLDWWVLAVASLLALFAVGGVAGRVAQRVLRQSTSELTVLLDESAAFYGRWPEDRLGSVPHGELVTEAARCRRIVELLERRTPAGLAGEPAQRGPIAGLREWITLLSKRIDAHDRALTGSAYA